MSDSGRTMREQCGHCHGIHHQDGSWYSCFETKKKALAEEQAKAAALRKEVEELRENIVEAAHGYLKHAAEYKAALGRAVGALHKAVHGGCVWKKTPSASPP